ncbi:MAG: pyrroline-5-carboxylate reductase [Actinomycetota bacterium]|nr:pyrroline-5-carboxylate reductase [Actinomycetota bacterium]
MYDLAIVGGGKMGSAIANGLVRSKFSDEFSILIVERDASAREELSSRLPEISISDSIEISKSYMVATKPDAAFSVIEALSESSSDFLLLSIVAGLSIASMRDAAGNSSRIIRAMPNTPAQIGKGVTALASSPDVTVDDIDFANRIFQSIGTSLWVPEEKFDAVTAVSGSGPAYFFLIAEAMVDAGVELGLSAEVAMLLVRETMLGSGALLSTNPDTRRLRLDVSSPGGTTIAATQAMQRAGIRSAISEGIRAAAQRSRDLSKR